MEGVIFKLHLSYSFGAVSSQAAHFFLGRVVDTTALGAWSLSGPEEINWGALISKLTPTLLAPGANQQRLACCDWPS